MPAQPPRQACSGHKIPFDGAAPSAQVPGPNNGTHIMTATTTKSPLITPVLLAGCVILMLSFAVRASFGVFQIPIATEFGWPRAEFSLAIAIQNLAWGIGQPMFGAIAERFGDRKAIISGAIL